MNTSVSKAAKPGLLCILPCSEAQPHKGSSEYEFECNEEKNVLFSHLVLKTLVYTLRTSVGKPRELGFVALGA